MIVRRYEVYDVRIVPFGIGLCRYCFVPGWFFFTKVGFYVLLFAV